jgi:hypothetical protein
MDLGQFNFDINVDLNSQSMNADSLFDFSFDQQPSSYRSNHHFSCTPAMDDQYERDQWAEPEGFQRGSHSQPHPVSMNSLSQLDPIWQSDWSQADSLISPRTTTLADNFWPDDSVGHPQMRQSPALSANSLLPDSPNWSLLESTIINGSSLDSTGNSTNNELSVDSDQPRRSRKRRATEALRSGRTSSETLELSSMSRLSSDIEPLDPSDLKFERVRYQAVFDSAAGYSSVPGDVAQLQNAAQLVSKSLRRIKRAPAEYISLGEELQQLEGTLARLQSSQHAQTIVSASELAIVRSLSAELQVLSPTESRPAHRRRNTLQALRPGYARELEVTARRLVRSLCATINSLEAHSTGTSTENRQVLSPSCNTQLLVSPSVSREDNRNTPASGSSVHSATSRETDRLTFVSSNSEASTPIPQGAVGNVESLDIYLNMDNVWSLAGGHLLRSVEGSRPIERIEQSERSLHDRVDSNSLASVPSPASTTYEAQRKTLSSGQTDSLANLTLGEQTGGLATSKCSRSMVATSSLSTDCVLRIDTVESRHSVISTATAVLDSASTEEVLLSHRSVENFHLATTRQNPSTVLQETTLSALHSQSSFAGALAVLGSLALTSSVWHPLLLPNL